MIIRLNEKYIDNSGKKFYFDFSDCRCSVNAIYDNHLNRIVRYEVEAKYFDSDYSWKPELLGFRCDVDDNSFNVEHYDESKVYYEKKYNACLLDLDTLYICFDNQSAYELYALNNNGEIIVLFRNISFQYSEKGEVAELIDDFLYYDEVLICDYRGSQFCRTYCNNDMVLEIRNNFFEDKFYVLTPDCVIYSFTFLDNYDFDGNEMEFSKGKAVIKENYNLEELLEIERMQQNYSKEKKEIYNTEEQMRGYGIQRSEDNENIRVYIKSLFDHYL